MKPIIRVENLSKQYRLGGERKSYSTFRESIVQSVRQPFNALRKNGTDGSRANSFWALRDINFEVAPGEVVGIIGRNGAGKSTLLKILSRITEPTTGKIELYGRVGSLLEVGTGFHPELSGRENIYLNGAILGMKQREIAGKFDEIVAFAEVEQFLDTPVKHYSSGMYTRLAFAVAANLEPEVLIVDEVLAVGDAEFQKKCLGKMKSVSDKDGRTVLFVSHNMTAVQTLCKKTISLNQGQIQQYGETSVVINDYLSRAENNQYNKEWNTIEEAPGNDLVKIKSIKLIPQFLDDSDVIDVRTPIDVFFEFWNLQPAQEINLSFHLYNLKGDCIMNLGTSVKQLDVGIARGKLSIPGNFLNDDSYYFSTMIVKDTSITLFNLEEAINFAVVDYRENTAWHGKWQGAVRPTYMDFTLEQISDNL